MAAFANLNLVPILRYCSEQKGSRSVFRTLWTLTMKPQRNSFTPHQKQKEEQCQIRCYVGKFNLCSKINLWLTQTGNYTPKSRSSRSQMFFKIGVLKNLTNFTGKYLVKKWFQRRLCAKFLRTSFLQNACSGCFLKSTKGLNWYILYITL